ncbi:hypothetical protein C7974DRAFT_379905 [Boeremia exigua]|uniref:uncharacterized protein n=1 Tax=Boeremia exigua TaxID=749465 RepID=UPI001E8D2BC3|nr:uncharacterized protein C7974DRAFT_379905 [Boeremia exigua]KAH6615017.1 hypothetical protein C7974DRAFT_379905 [Boeremia exigua]
MSALDTLPLEILFRVFDFIASPHGSISSKFHPLNSLAAASKHFDSAGEEYTRALLKRHANFEPRKRSKKYTSRKKWLAETCQLCYKKSKRRSTLWGYLTCCLACDKKHFPKVTMTNAINQYSLSKLDIFTPNDLHPALPSLAHGEYPVMGAVAIMIYEPDLASRRDDIHSQLRSVDMTEEQLRKRVRRHNKLIAHMEVTYDPVSKFWYRASKSQKNGQKPAKGSMQTAESRDKFVRIGLADERAAMHTQGASEETPIELN